MTRRSSRRNRCRHFQESILRSVTSASLACVRSVRFYLLFISQRLVDDIGLLAHAAEQVLAHPKSSMICWLDSPRSSFWATGCH